MTLTPELPVVVLSHRGPVSLRREQGSRTMTRGAGGLVTALVGLAEHLEDAVWVCAAVTDEDAALGRERGGAAVPVLMGAQPRIVDGAESGDAEEPLLNVRMVEVDPAAHEDFYTVISNPLLWFVQHGLYGPATAPVITRRDHAAYDQGYVPVNEVFADAVIDEVRRRDGRALVMLHDYHFYLVADRVRAACPDVVLTHFIHIPWPGPDAWAILPPRMRGDLLRGLLGNDVVAFHTDRFARNFLLCAQELLGLAVDLESRSVEYDGRRVFARSYPISIDVASLEQLAASAEVAEHANRLERALTGGDRRLILRVDRTDPSKNIVRGFLAFELLLEQHPELIGEVTFLALLQASRLDVPEYADYLGRIGAVAARINAEYERAGYQPVDLRLVQDLPLAVAAYTVCDVLLANSVADGMNLVAKEVVTVSRRDAVLVLSETTGAHEELGRFAVTVHPFDVQRQADALFTAVSMAPGERRERLGAAAAVVRRNDVGRWLQAQLADLAELVGLPTKER